MASTMEILHQAPELSSFVPISEHQSHTPQSFYSGPPVLHYRGTKVRLVTTRAEAERSPAVLKLLDFAQADGSTAEDYEESLTIPDLEIWVTSEKFILYRAAATSGVSIPYPSISLHAIQRLQDPDGGPDQVQGLYTQIVTSDGFDDHDPDGSISLTLIPDSTTISAPESGPEGAQHTAASTSPIQELFSAVSACANLHPDPVSPSSSAADGMDMEAEGALSLDHGPVAGLPPPMPGSGGWITADNMNEFFDEEGNWRGGGLGPGAGIVRERGEDEALINGDGEGTDGPDDETKWRRTS